MTNRARTYVEAASSVNTRKAYTADWKHFSAWCQRQNVALLPSDPRMRCRFDLDLDSRMDFDKIAA